jgi:hypothetical protein
MGFPQNIFIQENFHWESHSSNYTWATDRAGPAWHEPGQARAFAVGAQHGTINGSGYAVPKAKPRHDPDTITLVGPGR